jgi:hypothetical protein
LSYMGISLGVTRASGGTRTRISQSGALVPHFSSHGCMLEILREAAGEIRTRISRVQAEGPAVERRRRSVLQYYRVPGDGFEPPFLRSERSFLPVGRSGSTYLRVGVAGVEPAQRGSKPRVLPLDDTPSILTESGSRESNPRGWGGGPVPLPFGQARNVT